MKYKYMVELYRDFEHNELDAERYHFETLEKAETFIRTSNANRVCTKWCIYELYKSKIKKEEILEEITPTEYKKEGIRK